MEYDNNTSDKRKLQSFDSQQIICSLNDKTKKQENWLKRITSGLASSKTRMATTYNTQVEHDLDR